MLSLTSEQQIRLKHINIIRLLVFIGLLGALVGILFAIKNLFISLLLAFIISYLVRPFIYPLERAGLGYAQSLVLVYLLGLSSLFFIGFLILPFVSEQISGFQKEWPRYSVGLIDLIKNLELIVKDTIGVDVELKSVAESRLLSIGKLIITGSPVFLMDLASVLLMGPFLAFFMLKDGYSISKRFMVLVPNSVFEMVLGLQYTINKQLGEFIRARSIEAIIVGLITFIGLSILSFPFASLLGVFAALTNLIPYIGPIIGGAPAVAIALVNDWQPIDMMLVIGVYLIAQLIDVSILVPILVARIVNLHPVTVVLLIILGGQFMGVLGMIISIPLANALKVTFVAVYDHLTRFKK